MNLDLATISIITNIATVVLMFIMVLGTLQIISKNVKPVQSKEQGSHVWQAPKPELRQDSEQEFIKQKVDQDIKKLELPTVQDKVNELVSKKKEPQPVIIPTPADQKITESSLSVMYPDYIGKPDSCELCGETGLKNKRVHQFYCKKRLMIS